MEFIELHQEVYVELLLRILELVVFLDLCREEKSDTPTILIVNQTFIPVCMVDEPLKDLYARENEFFACHHV
jgi:hypothetical protein